LVYAVPPKSGKGRYGCELSAEFIRAIALFGSGKTARWREASPTYLMVAAMLFVTCRSTDRFQSMV
jgi:hypothetical protein